MISVGGDLEEVALPPGQSLRLSSGNLAAMLQSIDYNIEFVGGLKKSLFGGEGLFMTELTGPGKVLLQTLKRGVTVSTSSS
ncbi:MAG: AIM24 family protein [Pirellulaceae bacterium]|nr:AIM24 family protein [Pirellulaceae bacterium]